MSTGPVVRVQALPLELGGSRSPLWWGMAMLAVIEVVSYATLFTVYLYLRFHTPVWPPQGTPGPNVGIGVAGALLLLFSAGAVRWAVAGLLRERQTQLRLGFAAATAMAAVFPVLMIVERAMAGFRWDVNAYASAVWTITMVHTLQVLVLVVIGTAVWLLAGRGFYTRERRTGIEMLALFWYTIAVAWLPVFVVVYLIGW